MTDLTILIAVIALALWPIVFLISRILHERNKLAKPSGDTASSETEEETEEMTTTSFRSDIAAVAERRSLSISSLMEESLAI